MRNPTAQPLTISTAYLHLRYAIGDGPNVIFGYAPCGLIMVTIKSVDHTITGVGDDLALACADAIQKWADWMPDEFVKLPCREVRRAMMTASN